MLDENEVRHKDERSQLLMKTNKKIVNFNYRQKFLLITYRQFGLHLCWCISRQEFNWNS